MSTSAVAGLAGAIDLQPSLTLRGAYAQIASGVFVDDDTLIVASGANVHLVDVQSGVARESVVVEERVTRIVASEDGSTFACLDARGTISVRRKSTFDTSDTIADERSFSKLAIDATGTTIVTAIGNVGAIVDVVRGEVARELVGHYAQPAQERGEVYDAASIRAVAISRDGRIAITGGSDARAIVWDVATAKPLHVLEGHEIEVAAVAIDRNASTFATIDGAGHLRTWSSAGRALLEHRFSSSAIALAFAHAAATLAVLLEDGTLALLSQRGNGDAVWWQPVRTFSLPKPYPYSLDLSFDRSDATIAVASPRNIAIGDGWLDDSALVLVTLATRTLREVRVSGTALRSLVLTEARGAVHAFGALARPVRWDLAGDGVACATAWPPVFEAASSPSADAIAAIGIDGKLAVYDRNGAVRHMLATAETPVSFVWSRMGDALGVVVRGREHDTLRLFRSADGMEYASIALDRGTSAIAFAPSGTIVAVAREAIVAYEPRAGNPVWRIARVSGACAFPQAGNAFFVTYSDDPIALYDFADGKRVATFDDGRVNGGIDTDATGDVFVTHGYRESRLWSVRRNRVVARFDDLLTSGVAPRASFTQDATRIVFNVGNAKNGGCATVFDVGALR